MRLKGWLSEKLKKLQLRMKDNRLCAICVFSEKTFFVWGTINAQGRLIGSLHYESFEGSRQVAFKELKDWVKLHKFKGVQCGIILPPGTYRMLLMDELNVEPEERYSAIQWVCKDLITDPIDLMACDTFPIRVKHANDPKIYIVLSSKAELAVLRDEVHDLGLVVAKIDIVEFALAAWFSKIYDGHFAILYRRYQLIIIEKGEIRMSRKLGDWGEPLPKTNFSDLVTELEVSLRFYMEQFSNTIPDKMYVSSGLFSNDILQPIYLEKLPLKIEQIDEKLITEANSLPPEVANLGGVICEGFMHRWVRSIQLELGEDDAAVH